MKVFGLVTLILCLQYSMYALAPFGALIDRMLVKVPHEIKKEKTITPCEVISLQGKQEVICYEIASRITQKKID